MKLSAVLFLAVSPALFADINSTATLNIGSTLNLDTGVVSMSGTADIVWTGGSIQPLLTATVYGFPVSTLGSQAYAGLTQTVLMALPYSNTPASGQNVLSQWIIAVHTNGGHYAKLFVVSSAVGGSITLQYTTYGATASGGGGGGGGGGAPTPAVTEIQNNYSYIVPGLPNYGIAPGSLFIVKGTNLNSQPLSALQSSAAPGIPTTLNGTSISVTVGSTTVTPGLYYTSPTQLAGVLPSNTPVGAGTLTVTSNGQTSATAQIQVVASALGLDTIYGTGSGLATATDSNGNTFSDTDSAGGGETIVLWGSGVGADTSNDDKTFPLNQNNLTSIPLQMYIGGISATITYRGRSQYPGVDQVVVTIPANVPLGCAVSVVGVSGTVTTNSVTLPITAQSGGTCSDTNNPVNPTLAATLAGKATVSFGYVSVLQTTENTTTSNIASATFQKYPGSALASGNNSNTPSIGSCVIIGPGGAGAEPAGLDPGTVSLTGPGIQTTLPPFASLAGFFYTSLSSIPANGGAFTFSGSGGKDVGAFSTTINFPTPLAWTNKSSVTTVNRAAGQTVTWTGGAPGTYVSIGGQSEVSTGPGTVLAVTFTCLAPVNAGQFTVPSWVLLALPASTTGAMNMSNETNPQSFTASGLDYAYGTAAALIDISVVYQ